MEKRLARQYYSPNGYWKGFGAIKKLAQTANVSENVTKQWLFKQAFWQIYLPAPKRIARPKFDVPTPNKVHQADLLLCHTTNCHVDAKFSDTRSPLSTWPAATKRPNPWLQKILMKLRKLFRQFTSAAL